ncbi:uncharacterized protein At4g06744-like [Cornus florida]|uniref:uncharacterized protein At4g06744-like n=1 Tax=Cornus florida TaxID=4283 RepID=UPI0028A21383|nr:uncharacterized protein At4g06744-like [Cornus florida]
MGNLSFSAAILLLIFLVFHSCSQQAGGQSPPLPPPGCPCAPPLPPPPPGRPSPTPPKTPPVCRCPPKRRPRLAPAPIPPELLRDIRTIQRFKKRITYDPLNITKTWRGRNICTDPTVYKGFICGKINKTDRNRVAGVKFNGFNFNGNPLNVTDFIEDLKDLVFFHANSNNISGPTPARVALLPYFFELDFSNNKLTGSFPNEILGATNLTFMDVRFNQLTGSVPPQVFRQDLDVLFLNNNKFSGRLPASIGSTPALYLTLANNRFTGPIPKTIKHAATTLIEVLFLNNQLSGCLPYEIGLLKKVTIFDASINKLTGRIPYSLGCMARMQQLNLANNQLYGEIPEIVCRLKNLYKLTLKNNYFTVVGPQCRKLITKKVLDVSMNCIAGLPSQRSKQECDAFKKQRNPCLAEQRRYHHVPCQIANSTSQEMSESEDAPAPTPSIAPSPSYAALIKHG